MISINQQIQGRPRGFRDHYERIDDVVFDFHPEVVALKKLLNAAGKAHAENVAAYTAVHEAIGRSVNERLEIDAEIQRIKDGRPMKLATAFLRGLDFHDDKIEQQRVADLRHRLEALCVCESGLDRLLADGYRAIGASSENETAIGNQLRETFDRLKFEKTAAEYRP